MGICIFCFDVNEDTQYNSYGQDLVLELNQHNFKNIFVLTNQPTLFSNSTSTIVEYSPKKHSYFDKLTVCQTALKYHSKVLYIDCDSRVNYHKLNKLTPTPGLSVSESWNDGKFKTFSDMRGFQTHYFDDVIEYCEKNNLEIDAAPLFEERLFTLSKSNNLEEFFKIYENLRESFERNDERFGNYPVGRAEGLAMGIAAINTGLKYVKQDPKLKSLELRHLPNEN